MGWAATSHPGAGARWSTAVRRTRAARAGAVFGVPPGVGFAGVGWTAWIGAGAGVAPDPGLAPVENVVPCS